MNYKQTAVVGESWVRAHRVVIDNTYDKTPIIDFAEEEVTALASGTVVKRELDHLVQMLPGEAMQTTFAVLDPLTSEATGEVATFMDVYVLLHSLYYHFANARDEALEAAALQPDPTAEMQTPPSEPLYEENPTDPIP